MQGLTDAAGKLGFRTLGVKIDLNKLQAEAFVTEVSIELFLTFAYLDRP